MNTDPDVTLDLLAKLRALGFGDDAFRELHHDGKGFDLHEEYCKKTGEFWADGNNAIVQKRLQIVFDTYTEGGFKRRDRAAEIFSLLAQAATFEVPAVAW